MGDQGKGCFRWVLLALACIMIVLLLEIFGYAHRTYEEITGGGQYSEIGVLTQKAAAMIEESADNPRKVHGKSENEEEEK